MCNFQIKLCDPSTIFLLLSGNNIGEWSENKIIRFNFLFGIFVNETITLFVTIEHVWATNYYWTVVKLSHIYQTINNKNNLMFNTRAEVSRFVSFRTKYRVCHRFGPYDFISISKHSLGEVVFYWHLWLNS